MKDSSNTKRIVIKVGTNTLARAGGVDTDYIAGQPGHVVPVKHQ